MTGLRQDVAPPPFLCCPEHHEPLAARADALACPVCGDVGRTEGSIVSFLKAPDYFYEGKYNNRTRFVPKDDGFLATLPLRVVLQDYPTAVAREVAPGSTVVEIGCAGGIAWFGRRYRMVGLDLSRTALDLAAQDYVCAIQGDALAMPIAAESVDAVISSCLFEHFDAEGKAKLLSECRRVLKPGGKVVFLYDIETSNPVIKAYRAEKPDLYKTLFLDGDGHIGYETIGTNRAHFKHAGLEITRERFHERTPALANSAWKKLSEWGGARGALARIGDALTSGPARLPGLAMIAMIDTTLARLCPADWARCVTTIARKP